MCVVLGNVSISLNLKCVSYKGFLKLYEGAVKAESFSLCLCVLILTVLVGVKGFWSIVFEKSSNMR